MKKTFVRKTEIPEAIKERIDRFDYANICKNSAQQIPPGAESTDN